MLSEQIPVAKLIISVFQLLIPKIYKENIIRYVTFYLKLLKKKYSLK